MTEKTALITGGVSGIGREISINLVKRGFDIVATYCKSGDGVEEFRREIIDRYGVGCRFIRCDLSKVEEIKGLIEVLDKEVGNLELLVNNASFFEESDFFAEDEVLYDNLNIHFFAPLFLSKFFAARKPKKGNIINITDKNILRFQTSYFHYNLSKKFLADLTKMLAISLAPEIRVNSIAPGYIRKNEEIPDFVDRIPLKGIGNIDNITQGVDFILDNDFITGQIIFIDGGASLNHVG